MNIGNSSLFEIVNTLKRIGPKVTLYPHVNMDGDALGSCVALAYALTEMGKDCVIVLSEEIPGNLEFLDASKRFCKNIEECEKNYINSDAALLIDSGELKRIPGRDDLFKSAKIKICIDHHGTSEAFCDLNYIDPNEAATGQIIWNLINTMELDLSKEVKRNIAEAIFTAITTDTGNFQYSNTQKKSHEIVANLYEWGLDANKVSVKIYESNRVERLRLTSEVLSKLELLVNGKVALAYCSQEMLRMTGAKMEETEWIAGDLRGISGVEVAVFLKEEEENKIKVSLRSKEYFDVAALAKELNGGGHVRASGYTAYKSLNEAVKEIKEKIEKAF